MGVLEAAASGEDWEIVAFVGSGNFNGGGGGGVPAEKVWFQWL